jgi:hypothetical protein
MENIINIIKDIRLIDDQPPDRAVEHRGQLCGDDFDMPAEREQGARVELAKTAPRKARKVATQQPVIPVRGHRLVHLSFTTETQSVQRYWGRQFLLLENVAVMLE